MAIIPTGSPAWLRTATHSDYGGNTSKRNFMSRGVVDPLTDVGAEDFVRICADLEAAVRTVPFATLTYLNSDSVPAAPTVQSALLMTGVRVVSYVGDAAPAGFPSAVRNGTGDVTFTFASSYTDPYGVAGTFAISHYGASGSDGAGGIVRVTTERPTATTLRVRCFNSAGAALGNCTVTLRVW